MLLSTILFILIIGVLIACLSLRGFRFQGILMMCIAGFLGILFYFFYAYNKTTWRRIPVIETVFADFGAALGVIAVVSMAVTTLIYLQRKN